MKTCKTCEWWSGDDREEFDRDFNIVYSGRRHCACPKIVFRDDYQDVTADGAELVDGSGYYAAIYTGPDFGCIHHTPKGESDG